VQLQSANNHVLEPHTTFRETKKQTKYTKLKTVEEPIATPDDLPTK